MSKLVYEFESVTSLNGVDKLTTEHANPVFIKLIAIGAPAIMVYVDSHNHSIRTSKIQSVNIFDNGIHFTSVNTNYHLKPYIREGE